MAVLVGVACYCPECGWYVLDKRCVNSSCGYNGSGTTKAPDSLRKKIEEETDLGIILQE